MVLGFGTQCPALDHTLRAFEYLGELFRARDAQPRQSHHRPSPLLVLAHHTPRASLSLVRLSQPQELAIRVQRRPLHHQHDLPQQHPHLRRVCDLFGAQDQETQQERDQHCADLGDSGRPLPLAVARRRLHLQRHPAEQPPHDRISKTCNDPGLLHLRNMGVFELPADVRRTMQRMRIACAGHDGASPATHATHPFPHLEFHHLRCLVQARTCLRLFVLSPPTTFPHAPLSSLLLSLSLSHTHTLALPRIPRPTRFAYVLYFPRLPRCCTLLPHT